MHMQDSRKNRRRIAAYLASRGGALSSGGDNLFGYLYRQAFPAHPTFEGVTGLRQMVEKMAEDGVLELTCREDGKVTGITLVRYEQLVDLDEGDRQHFTSAESVWSVVVQLLVELDRSRRREASTLEAFESLSGESGDELELQALRARVAELETSVPTCDHEAEIAEIRADSRRQLEAQIAAGRRSVRHLSDELSRCRTGAEARERRDHERIADLERIAAVIPPQMQALILDGTILDVHAHVMR